MRQKHTALCLLASTLLGWQFPANAESGGWEDPSAPRLEIRQYRFSNHPDGFDRLVLEFERRDSNPSAQPRLRSSNSGREAQVTIENALLLGAIPESLINDSFLRRSRYLGPITVGMDAPKTGFSLRAAMKSGGSRVEASWLSNPPRLVLDAYGDGSVGRHVAAGHGSRNPSLSEVICFPAGARVGLTVIFKPNGNYGDQLQNIRINTDGVQPQETRPSPDAIVCYPRRAQIQAALSFEYKPASTYLSQQSQTEQIFAPVGQQPAAAAVGPTDSDLDPGPLTVPSSLGQLPLSGGGGADRNPSGALSLLPPTR